MTDLFIASSDSLPSSARVIGFRGVEGLSRLFSFEVLLSCDRGHVASIDFDRLTASRFGLTMLTGPLDALAGELGVRTPVEWRGIVSAVELVSESGERAVLKLEVVPKLWLLTQSFNSRVFTGMSIIDILVQVLRDRGFTDADFELRLGNAYAVEEHVCQYRETDFDFFSRWMEREGLYYFFEHGERGEKLVIVDDRSQHVPFVVGATRYVPSNDGDVSRAEGLHRAALGQKAVVGTVRFSDHDYRAPALDLVGSETVSDAGGEMSHYGDRVFSVEQAKRLARLTAEALRADAVVLHADGTTRNVRPGFTLDVVDHPRAALNQTFLVTAAEHFGRQSASPELDELFRQGSSPSTTPARTTRASTALASGATYRVVLDGVPATLQWRPLRTTPWPRVHGFESATIDGAVPGSTYAQIDEDGRYQVRMLFDQAKPQAGKGSTRVRMAQPHGGSSEGFHFPLRAGTEVLVQFLDGDPDRPVIAGVLPNANKPSPIDARNATKNVLQTGGQSRMEIEDAAGGQYMNLTTPVANSGFWMGSSASAGGHNVELTTDGTGGESFGSTYDRFVGGPKSEHVVAPHTRGFDSTYTTTVAADVSQSYLANVTQGVTGNVTSSIAGMSGESVVGPVARTYVATRNLNVTGDVSQTYSATRAQAVGGSQQVDVTGAGVQTYEAGSAVTVSGGLSKHTANVDYDLVVNATATVKASSALAMRGDATAQLGSPETSVLGETVVVDAPKVTVAALTVDMAGSAGITVAGPMIEIEGGDVLVLGGVVDVNVGPLELKAAGANVMAAAGPFSMSAGSQKFDGQVNLNLGGAASGLGPDVDALVALSPTLSANIAALLADGWTIQYGPAGDGTYADRSKKIIVIDSGQAGDPASVAESLAHETGHARYNLPPMIGPEGMTKDEFVAANTNSNLLDEGEATLTNARVRNEILANGGPDIGVAGDSGGNFQGIHDSHPNHERDQARQEIADQFGTLNPSTDPSKTYTDYYGEYWEQYYDWWKANNP